MARRVAAYGATVSSARVCRSTRPWTGELKQLALEMIPVFSSLQIHREALAALSFLLEAIQSESASAKLVAAVANYLRQAERDPSVPFQVPEP